ncbi:hypothetical protein Glove_428g61 [Diversispora epigaea]|uniref:Uncharacterized protein n=1 Tax=Diversispora epigaea TaxID=1348612 RepID=A0A397GUJ9_9GLOM|nr:hypothetical protein Glove_428g61 [Diversispora epigaea]
MWIGCAWLDYNMVVDIYNNKNHNVSLSYFHCEHIDNGAWTFMKIVPYNVLDKVIKEAIQEARKQGKSIVHFHFCTKKKKSQQIIVIHVQNCKKKVFSSSSLTCYYK